MIATEIRINSTHVLDGPQDAQIPQMTAQDRAVYNATLLQGVDPRVIRYINLSDPQIARDPTQPSRLGEAPTLTQDQFLGARRCTLSLLIKIADALPDRDDLLINLDTIPGGPALPYVSMAFGKGEVFDPDNTVYSTAQYKKYAARCAKVLSEKRSTADLAGLMSLVKNRRR